MKKKLQSPRSVKPYYTAESAALLQPLLDKLHSDEAAGKLTSAGVKIPITQFGCYRAQTVRQKVFQAWEWLADNHGDYKYKELRRRFVVKLRNTGIFIQPCTPINYSRIEAQSGSTDMVSNMNDLNEWLESGEPTPLTLAVGNESTVELEASLGGLSNVAFKRDGQYITFVRK